MIKVEPMAKLEFRNNHQWITVVNPTNRRLLLQACDNCGVVKSQNTVARRCGKSKGQRLISSVLGDELLFIA